MNFHQIAIFHEITSFHHLTLEFCLAPDSSKLEILGQLSVHSYGHIKNRASLFQHIRSGIGFLLFPGSLRVDAYDFQDIEQQLGNLAKVFIGKGGEGLGPKFLLVQFLPS